MSASAARRTPAPLFGRTSGDRWRPRGTTPAGAGDRVGYHPCAESAVERVLNVAKGIYVERPLSRRIRVHRADSRSPGWPCRAPPAPKRLFLEGSTHCSPCNVQRRPFKVIARSRECLTNRCGSCLPARVRIFTKGHAQRVTRKDLPERKAGIRWCRSLVHTSESHIVRTRPGGAPWQLRTH